MASYWKTSQKNRVCSWQRVALNGLLCVALLVVGMVPTAAVPVARAQTAQPTVVDAVVPSTGEIAVQAAGVSALDAAPPEAEAVVSDPRNPAWQTRYGSLAGKQSLAPRYATFQTAVAGPEIPLGAWQTHPLQGGNKAVTALASLPDGRLFAGVADSGLWIYAPGAEGVYTWTPLQAAPNGLASNAVTALAIFQNKLWVGTANAGISVWDLAANSWSTFNTGNGLPSNTIHRLTVAEASQPLQSAVVWASTPAGAARYSKPLIGNFSWTTFDTADGLPSNDVLDVAVWSHQGNTDTLIATENGVVRFNGSTMSAFHGDSNCIFTRATRIVVDHGQDLWLAVEDEVPELVAAGTDATNATAAAVPGGVCHYDAGLLTGKWERFSSFQPGLPSNFVSDLSVDGAGRVWMSFQSTGGNSTGGVASYDQGAWLIFRPNEAPLGDGQLTSVLAVGEAVWFGQRNAATLSVYSPNWTYYGIASVGSPGTGEVIAAVGEATSAAGAPGALLVEAERTWVGSGTGISRFEAGEWHYRNLPGNSSPVTSILRGIDGLLYIATAGSGLFSYDGADAFAQQTTAQGLPSNTLRDLLIDQDGRLWVATDQGLALRGANYWLTFTPDNSGLVSNDLTGLTLDGMARLWIGTAANGINVFDPSAGGQNGWSLQATANGLPADAINALATEPSGAIWAGTTAGLARWNPADNSWTVYNQSNGLPGNEILSLAIDSTGLVWAGTGHGLAQLQADAWLVYHVTGSFLGADRVRYLAADDKQLWASAGDIVAVRGVLDGPIGDFPPQITAISPLEGAPLSQITITGNHFDDRGPAYNQVTFCCFGVAAKVISATTTSLIVEVPLLAKSGKIMVKAHNLTVESTQEFQIVPVITSISETCAGPGTMIEIHGRGFFGVGDAAAYVTIGSGPERLADVQDPTLIRQYIRPGDTTGAIKIRLLNGKTATSAPGITIASPMVTATAIQQAVQGEQMIWGKRTLVQLFLRTTYPDYCNVTIDKGVLEWKKKDGTTQIGGYGLFPAAGGLQVPNAPPMIAMDTGINFVAEFNALRQAYTQSIFPFSQFDGVKITLKRGIIEVMKIEIPASQFNYIDIGDQHHFLNVPVVPNSWSVDQEAAFWANARKGIEDVARVYPQADTEGLRYGERQWMWEYHWSPVKVDYYWLGDPDDDDDDEPDDNFSDIKDAVDDIREDLNDTRCDGGNAADDDCRPWLDQAMGIVEASLYQSGSYGGKATTSCSNPFHDCDRNSAISTNFADSLAPVYLQEAIHALEWVDEDAANHDDANDHHSRYDEGEWNDIANCNPALTFRRALIDQTGGLKRVVRLDENDPYQFPMPSSVESACKQDQTPKSAMSYVPGQRDWNAFLEPVDYRHTLNWIRDNGLMAQAASATLANVDQTLRINGRINQANGVTVTLSSILGTEGAVLSTPGGDYHLVLIGADNQVLYDHAFNLAMEHTHTDADESVESRFNLRVPFPAGTQMVAIQHDGLILWAKTVSANAPTASVVTPNGGSFNAAEPLNVTWQAADADGDALQVALDYTPDNGVSWFLIANKLTGTSYAWTPGFVPASNAGRLRLRVSDGFNTAEVLSAPFELKAKAPLAFIDSPVGGATVTEGSIVNFEGGSLTGDGFDTGSFEWRKNGQTLALTRTMTQALDTVGVHLFELEVTADGLSASQSVSVTVLADYDRDGMPNEWEQGYEFNPIDPADALNDLDGDGLSNLAEYKRGTHPLVADSDGDTRTDGVEVTDATDPLVADAGITSPTLQVGASLLGYKSYANGVVSDPQSFWVTNGGPGDLNWTATSDAAWLSLSTTQGAAPTELTVSVNPAGLTPGNYTGVITFTAPGAADSPQTVTVKLTVSGENAPVVQRIFLPVVTKQ
jgi:ligand-binding sensor domain-containing protein